MVLDPRGRGWVHEPVATTRAPADERYETSARDYLLPLAWYGGVVLERPDRERA
jgi:hypothetical protein